jgi:hypothetical protein
MEQTDEATTMESRTTADPMWERVDQIWADYQKTHGDAAAERVAVGIDPATGDVFLGSSAKDITMRLIKEGRPRRLYFRWSDDPFYTHKGARR